MSAYVMYGFDTAGTLAEETNDPRRAAPPAIIRALITASIIGGLLILFALMAVKNINDPNIGLLGLPYIIKQALGNTLGNVFLIDSAIAITVCTLAVMAACIRLLFAMARDGRLPFGTHIARVSGTRRVPIVPALVVGILALVILAVNFGNQSAFVALTSVAIVMFYLAYLGGHRRHAGPAHQGNLAARRARPVLLARPLGLAGQPHRGRLRRGRRGQHRVAALGRLRLAGGHQGLRGHVIPGHWYWQYIAILFIGIVFLIGTAYYFAVYRRKPIEVLREHAAAVPTLPDETPMGEAAP